MNIAGAIDIGSLEAQLSADSKLVKTIDTILPIELTTKPTGVFSSDCCGCNT